MGAARILGALSFVFLGAALWRSLRERALDPASRTWFLIGSIFALVSLFSWLSRRT